jgi:hypothetical protein
LANMVKHYNGMHKSLTELGFLKPNPHFDLSVPWSPHLGKQGDLRIIRAIWREHGKE